MDKLLYEVAFATDVGTIRLNNEDALFCDPDRGLFLVCDGMGGEQAGEVASQLAATTISSLVCSNPPRRLDEVDQFFFSLQQDPPHTHSCRIDVTDRATLSDESQLMILAIEAANDEIHTLSEIEETHRGMGTTVAAILITSAIATVAHVGDSRVYLLRNNSLKALTKDHTFGAEQIRAGVSGETVHQLPNGNFLTRALGPNLKVEPEISEVCVHGGDAFLLATDGLIGPVSDHEILLILEIYPRNEDACRCLIEAAKNNGGSDNISCVLVRLRKCPVKPLAPIDMTNLWADLGANDVLPFFKPLHDDSKFRSLVRDKLRLDLKA
jgi:serine/threonine protein phosphatase PrpC